MFGFKTFGAGLVLGGAMSLFATNYHVVQSNDGVVVLPRSSQPPLRSSYVDVRQWNLAMWEQHPEVAQAMVKSGRTDLMVTGAMTNIVPGQVQPTTLEKFGQSVSEKTKEAYKSLVPIKFTNQEGNEMVLPEGLDNMQNFPLTNTPQGQVNVPNMPTSIPAKTPVQPTQQASQQLGSLETFLGDSVSTIPTPEQYQQEINTQVEQGFNHLQNQAQELLPEEVKSFQLPKLQNPIPIQEDPFQQASTAASSVQTQVQGLQAETSNTSGTEQTWVKGLLNSIVPQDNSQQAPVNHGQAQIPFKIDAPNPLEDLRSQTSSLMQREIEQALPSVKSF